MISLAGVRKYYEDAGGRRLVLDGVTLAIGRGEFCGIVGVSGSGKSTLLHIMGGLDTNYEGEARVGGKTLARLSDTELSAFRGHTIGFVFQAFHLLNHLTCLENVLLPAAFTLTHEDWRARAAAVLERVGLKERMHQKPLTLSGGERQRAAIARALLMRPAILLCDEPTGNLDYQTADGVLAIFQELNAEGITVVTVTHEDRVAAICPRVVTLAGGRIVSDERKAA